MSRVTAIAVTLTVGGAVSLGFAGTVTEAAARDRLSSLVPSVRLDAMIDTASPARSGLASVTVTSSGSQRAVLVSSGVCETEAVTVVVPSFANRRRLDRRNL